MWTSLLLHALKKKERLISGTTQGVNQLLSQPTGRRKIPALPFPVYNSNLSLPPNLHDLFSSFLPSSLFTLIFLTPPRCPSSKTFFHPALSTFSKTSFLPPACSVLMSQGLWAPQLWFTAEPHIIAKENKPTSKGMGKEKERDGQHASHTHRMHRWAG